MGTLHSQGFVRFKGAIVCFALWMMGAVLGEGSVAGRGGHCGGQQGGAGIGLLSFSTLPL